MIFESAGASIIVPLMGTTPQVLVEEAIEAEKAGADVVEWRVDFLFGDHPNFSFSSLGREIIPQILKAVSLPLLLTIRTSIQGGEIKLSTGRYRLLLAEMLDTLMQLRVPAERIGVDIEFWYEGAPDLVKRALELGYTPVVSDHNWSETPDSDVLEMMFEEMLEMDDVVAKLAVTAMDESDVDRLLEVTEKVTKKTGRPVIAVSMGPLGTRARIEGWRYGSVATFAAVSRQSAPGQPSIVELRKQLAEAGVALAAAEDENDSED
ncbi:MAG: type I 3-dehydroquinate dehydratase [Actinomycetaceae bacterium]|nr:type I 3-dehydroquinate dehydratase [Actinomycetaceae bacterium]